MASINQHYLDLPGNYLFSEIARRVTAYGLKNPESRVIRLGIGDVTSPLVPTVAKALYIAAGEQASSTGFHGYGPEQGYAFLREAIVESSYQNLGIAPDEIFIGSGAKEDIGNFPELFDDSCKVAVTDPAYPVYVDSAVMSGRAGSLKPDGRYERIIYLPCVEENGFVPELPKERPDLIYLCYPNNPTGTVLTRDQLRVWVEYARREACILFFDAAYEAYSDNPDIPHSIYEIEGAKEVAVEFRSYSKTAGFTGLRCGYTVVPKTVMGSVAGEDGKRASLHALWLRRQTTKYNGCPYIVQRTAAATHTPQGGREIRAQIAAYMQNAASIRQAFECLGLHVYGGKDAPYVWVRLPKGMGSWAFFDLLLEQAGIVGTPGVGFGPSGEGYFRLTGFGQREETEEALRRLASFAL